MKKTINEFMVCKKVLIERVVDLKQLRQQTAIDKITIQRYGEDVTETRQEAKYDTKALDRRVTEIQNALLLIDSAIKQMNASVQIDLAVDLDHLLSPME